MRNRLRPPHFATGFTTMLAMLLTLSGFAAAQTRAPAPPPALEFTQRLRAQLPLQATFNDEAGRARMLGNYFDRKPVLLVLGYYHCPNLCSTLMDGILEAVAKAGLSADALRIVEVSIDPSEKPELAQRRKSAWEPQLGKRGGELHLLTGDKPAIDAVARAAGFGYAWDAAQRQYVHPAGFLLATPDGRIARYFLGVRFDADALRLAAVEASEGRVGSAADRLLLLCSHYDPALGRYTVTAMTVVRLACAMVALMLAGWVWAHRSRRKGAP